MLLATWRWNRLPDRRIFPCQLSHPVTSRRPTLSQAEPYAYEAYRLGTLTCWWRLRIRLFGSHLQHLRLPNAAICSHPESAPWAFLSGTASSSVRSGPLKPILAKLKIPSRAISACSRAWTCGFIEY